jgi:hypothetical protein
VAAGASTGGIVRPVPDIRRDPDLAATQTAHFGGKWTQPTDGDEEMTSHQAELREKVRLTYSKVADQPHAKHPFRVGRGVAKRAGYSPELLSIIPAASVDAYAGVSCVPCFAEIPAGARVSTMVSYRHLNHS